MRAEKEFKNWIKEEKFVTAEGGLEEAYIAGFSKAIELVEQSLKGELNEQIENLSSVESRRDRTSETIVPLCRGN